ncbi:MAG: winged helix DNA-binding domain-containing protein [Microbacterium sp.]
MADSRTQRIRDLRLRSHRLSAPARTVGAAGEHMLATQGQEFWGGRLALAARTKGSPTISRVDRAFDSGELVRSWTMRGTVHVIPARHLAWVLSLTGERQFRAAGSRHRMLGLDADALARAEQAARSALAGGNRLTRAEFFDVLRAIGIDPRDQRGVHALYALSVRGVVVQGPVVPRESGPTREQFVVLAEEWIAESLTPADPLLELFTRYVASHGPAGAADFAWWSGLPLGMARQAVAAADSRLARFDDDLWVAADVPRRHPSAPDVVALPPFEEYFLSYADRTRSCAPEHASTIMTGGAMRPILLARGEIVATWSHSLALARLHESPVPEWLVEGAATEAEASVALERYRLFMTG